MNSLKLNINGIEEISLLDSQKINGGMGAVGWLLLGIIISEILDRNAPNDLEEGYQKGYEAGKKVL